MDNLLHLRNCLWHNGCQGSKRCFARQGKTSVFSSNSLLVALFSSCSYPPSIMLLFLVSKLSNLLLSFRMC